jgi:hypothetical protein
MIPGVVPISMARLYLNDGRVSDYKNSFQLERGNGMDPCFRHARCFIGRGRRIVTYRFMSTIPKEQVLQLKMEHQETLAAIEIQHSRQKQEHLERARRYRGQIWVPALVFSGLCLAPVFTFQRWLPSCVVFLVISLWFLIQFHAAGVNRRLDALLELLETKKKNGEDL